ncbi:hypothetical protein [Lentibacillus sediminis]|nr:hypothetical protein [Lentibacillus sediminis]
MNTDTDEAIKEIPQIKCLICMRKWRNL